MDKLATLYRAAQFYAQRAHQLMRGPSFRSDHAMTGEFYEAYDGAYDALVERMIGLGEKPDIVKINTDACAMFKEISGEASNDIFFSRLMKLEREFCKEIDADVKGASQGTANLLQGLCDDSEKRQYQIGQRVAK